MKGRKLVYELTVDRGMFASDLFFVLVLGFEERWKRRGGMFGAGELRMCGCGGWFRGW